ncbi:unnamed protein product, partial [Amoebophrya sp. A25]
ISIPCGQLDFRKAPQVLLHQLTRKGKTFGSKTLVLERDCCVCEVDNLLEPGAAGAGRGQSSRPPGSSTSSGNSCVYFICVATASALVVVPGEWVYRLEIDGTIMVPEWIRNSGISDATSTGSERSAAYSDYNSLRRSSRFSNRVSDAFADSEFSGGTSSIVVSSDYSRRPTTATLATRG